MPCEFQLALSVKDTRAEKRTSQFPTHKILICNI